MFDHGLEYLRKKLPEFEKKPTPPPPTAAASAQTTVQPAKAPPPTKYDEPDAKMLDSIVAFLRRYLVCDDYQLNLLALWIVHTYCFHEFPTTAYLDIRSPESQCGKTRCLELLNILCDVPWLVTSAATVTLKRRLLHQRSFEELQTRSDKENVFPPPYAVLLDNCHHILGSSERQPLLAMLTSGARQTALYACGDTEYCLFGPKAFAGNGHLPRSLAEHCIPIVMRRKRPAESVSRFNPDAVSKAAADLLDWLKTVRDNATRFAAKANETPQALPPNLTARQQDCAEPLLHIADAIGGNWPQRARNAIVAAFKLSQDSAPVQALSDVRAWFYLKNNPEYLFTRDLLPLLTSMDYRPWGSWTNKSGRKLGKLLFTFGIFSRSLKFEENGKEKKIKGYVLKDFKDAWERYLPPIDPAEAPQPSDSGK